MSKTSSACCACTGPADPSRRRVLGAVAAGVAAPVAFTAMPAWAGPTVGDKLVEEDAEGAPAPIKVSDLKIGKPLVVYPFDAATKKPRDETRLNKLVLLRFAESDLDGESKKRAAGGVLAFSAVCTHQGCDVKTWLSKEKALVCYCHSSKFALLDNAAVTAGPAPRPLPSIALALDGETLVVAGAFSANPGGAV